MAPIKGINSKSVGKFLNNYRTRDAVGTDRISSKFFTDRRVLIEATGGQAGSGAGIEPGDGFRYYVFTNPGANPWVVTAGDEGVDYIVVGGGGGGGTSGGGTGSGGGAGGMLKNWPSAQFTGPTSRNVGPAFPVQAGTYTITVGDGGSGGGPPAYPLSPDFRDGDKGSSSSIAGPTITTIEVEGGGQGVRENQNGQPGGSGGGGAGGPGAPTSNKTGGAGENYPGPNQQGFPGGSPNAPTAGGGGGGGSAFTGGSTGWDGSGLAGGRGGDGDGFGGIPTDYGTPGPEPTYRYFAGGGGGTNNPSIFPGGYGGGGDGARRSGTAAEPGTANTGGGGGGGSDPTPTNHGKPGGSGIVIIRVKTS